MTQPDSPRPHRTARQCRAALAAVLLVLAPGAVWALADAGPPAELDQPGDRQGDPRLHRLQTLLSELELYRGPIDGQPRPAVTAALRQFEQSAQLPLTGELSDGLFDQLEAAVRLRRLTRFLMNLGREQSDQARAALLSQPSTRDLVAPGASSGPAAPNAAPGAVFACVRAPQASCLVAAAVEAGDAVEEVKLRDWALSEIVKAQARSGIDDGARASIRRMTDARQIIVSLRDLAAIQAERRDADAALATARSIPETLARVDAALAIASRQIEAGDRVPARATVELAATGIGQLAEPLQRIALRARLATLRWRSGDETEAEQEIGDAEAEARRLPARDSRATGLDFVATALAEMGRPADAVRLIADHRIGEGAPAALGAAAAAAARARDPVEARRIAGLIEQPRFRTLALVQIAAIAARHGEPDNAVVLLGEASRVAEAIEDAIWRDYPLSRVAEGYIDLKQPGPAGTAARAIADTGMRARLLYLVAHVEAALGTADALATATEAERVAAAIVSPLDHCWMLTEVAVAFRSVNDRPAAREMLQRATEIAAAIQDPASRARAFSRVASVMQDL